MRHLIRILFSDVLSNIKICVLKEYIDLVLPHPIKKSEDNLCRNEL